MQQEVWIIKCDGSTTLSPGYYWRYANAQDVFDLEAGNTPRLAHISAYHGPFASEYAAQTDSERQFAATVENMIARMKLK